MTYDQLAITFATIVGVCAGIAGLGIGILIGYLIGRHERKPTWDWDKLKRSDHFHYDRKHPKDGK